MHPAPKADRPSTPQPPPVSGAAMDRAVAAPRWRRWWPWAVATAVLLTAAAGLAAVRWPGRLGPVVDGARLATVQAGTFRDELVLRARAEPLRVVALDALDNGRVEAVHASDGQWVTAGQLLFRLRSPELEQLLLQRHAEVAQHRASVAAQRSTAGSTAAQERRELAQLAHAAAQSALDAERQQALAAAGFLSPAAARRAQDQAALDAQLLAQARRDHAEASAERARSLTELAQSADGLARHLALLEEARAQWAVRAPMAGRLSGFAVQVGRSLRAGEALGRIEDPASGLQLMVEFDEFYLPRIGPQLRADSSAGPLRLAQLLPRVESGRARALLRFEGAAPALRAGQTLEVRLQLGDASPALLLPDGPGVHETLYVAEGPQRLRRRSVRLGRRGGGQVEVLGGLVAGERVLISATPHTEDSLRLP